MKIQMLAVASLLSVLASTNAMANECHGRFSQTYENAKRDRKAEVYRSWNARGRDCSFQTDLESIFQFFDESGPAIRSCKNKGVNDGTLRALEQIGQECARQGRVDGKLDGKAYAIEFCAEDVIYARASLVGDYEIAYETKCADEFHKYVNNNCASKVSGDFNDHVKRKCAI